MFNINNRITLSRNSSRINILNNNNNLRKGGVENVEVKQNNKEEDLVREEAKSYILTVGI